jgi:hypothetical protein
MASGTVTQEGRFTTAREFASCRMSPVAMRALPSWRFNPLLRPQSPRSEGRKRPQSTSYITRSRSGIPPEKRKSAYRTDFRDLWSRCGTKRGATPRDQAKLSKAQKNSPLDRADLAAIQEEMDTINRALVSVLRTSRQDADITQAEIGRSLAVSEDVVSNIEALKRPLSFAQAVLWARSSGMDGEELMQAFVSRYRKMRSRVP